MLTRIMPVDTPEVKLIEKIRTEILNTLRKHGMGDAELIIDYDNQTMSIKLFY